MTLIQGVGDEVIQFVVALILIFIVALAWCTTYISNESSLRTVFLVERGRLRAAFMLPNQIEPDTSVGVDNTSDTEENQPATSAEEKPPDSIANPGSSSANSEIQVVDEETRIVEAMDSDSSSELRRRRLTFFRQILDRRMNRTSEDNPTNENDSGGNECVQQSRTESMPDVTDQNIKTDCSVHEEDVTDQNDGICIKLMFLNDQLKIVNGKLHEKLGDFKRRHFQDELANDKVIKLIFNGHILQQDADTLEKCGLFDNCVVHCLVRQNLNLTNLQNSETVEPNFVRHNMIQRIDENQQQNGWHLENCLFIVLFCFLGVAWYLRYVYSHLYTITATIGLILMTGIFTLVMIGIRFPDTTEQNQQRVENAQAQQ